MTHLVRISTLALQTCSLECGSQRVTLTSSGVREELFPGRAERPRGLNCSLKTFSKNPLSITPTQHPWLLGACRPSFLRPGCQVKPASPCFPQDRPRFQLSGVCKSKATSPPTFQLAKDWSLFGSCASFLLSSSWQIYAFRLHCHCSATSEGGWHRQVCLCNRSSFITYLTWKT